MKKIILVLISISVVGALYMLFITQSKNKDLESKINNLKSSITEQEKINEENKSKKQALEKLKEEKQEQIEKYEEVESWNKEIIDYIQQ